MKLTKFQLKTKIDVLYLLLNLFQFGIALIMIWSLFIAFIQLFTIIGGFIAFSNHFDLETKRQIGNFILIIVSTLYFACSYYIVTLLLKFLTQINAKKIFSGENSKLLNKAGLFILLNFGIVLLGFVLTGIYNSYFIYQPDQIIQGSSFTIPLVGGFDLTTIIFSLCLLILAEIFKQGESLKREQDLVV